MRFLILTILYLFIALQIVIAQFININITNNSSDQTEPYISINPLNKSHVFAVYHDYSGGTDCKAGYGFSTDKGSTWNKGVLWGPPNSNYYFGIDPSVSIDNNGRVFYTYFARPAQNEGSKFLGLVYTVYTDNNGTYWNYTSVDPDNNDVDKPFMCIDNSGSIYDGRIYVCWVDVTDNDIIKFSYSSDRGESFISPPYELDESSSVMSGNIDLYPSETNKIITEDRVGSPMPMVGPDGELYVFWYDADDIQGFNGCIFEMAKSQDGGRTFSYPITISNFTFRFGNYGALEYASFISFVSIDPITGYIYIVYSDQYSQSNTNLKIKFVRSTNGGENWESPMIIGDLGAGQHLMPCMSVDKSGKLSVMFLHYTNTQFLKTYIIESFDHGNNFLEPILVSSGISNPNVSINKNHYNGIFNSVGGDSYCVWTDYRDNTANIYYSLVNSLDYYSEENKSVDQNATAGNNGRKVVRDGSGNYHIVFSSGGEIFYHKTTDGGSSWLEPVRLSESNGFNSYPSISESSGNIYATWQRNTNGNDYDVYFAASTDNGSTWGNKYVLVNRSSAEGPRPVIQSKYTNSMIILQSNSGLDAFLTESTNPSAGSWRRTPDLPGYSTSYSPTLTTGLQDGIVFPAAYANSYDDHVYYEYYDTRNSAWTGGPTNLSLIVPGRGVNKQPSITNVPGSNEHELHAAWKKLTGTGSSYYDHVIYHRRSTDYNTWPNEYFQTYYQCQDAPSISAQSATSIDLVFQMAEQFGNSSYKMHFNSHYWNAPTLISTFGRYPSLSMGSNSAKYIWTEGSNPLHDIELSSETLTLTDPIDPLEYYTRSISLLDSTGSYLNIKLHSIGFELNDGTIQKLDFSISDLSDFNLTPSNCFDSLASTILSNVPINAENIVYDVSISGSGINNIFKNNGHMRIAFKLFDRRNLVLRTIKHDFNLRNGEIEETRNTIKIPLNGLGIINGQTKIKSNCRIKNIVLENGVFASLGHIFDYSTLPEGAVENDLQKTKKTEKELHPNIQNYPNPFNPTTTIRFTIVKPSYVTLKVYDVLGRMVKELVNEFKPVGEYEATFDASNLTTGIYFYKLQAGNYTSVKKMMLIK